MIRGLALAAVGFLIASNAFAQDAGVVDRPSEDALFGAPERPSEDALFQQSPAEAQTPGDEKKPATDGPLGKANEAAQSDDARGDEILGGPASKDKFITGEFVDDPLKIGGQFYLRYFGNAVDNTQFKNIAFSSPNLLDLYLDGRPNDRVRAFARFRMRYDPTYDPAAQSSFAQFGALAGATASSSNQSQDTGTRTVGSNLAPERANPDFLLDQLWLNFDILRQVYLTAGRQHIRWTVSRFWQPTDFLSPQLRDPLAVFDQRLGANALKLHLPIEALGWNFYAVTLLDNFGPANTFGELGQAFRAEVVVGPAEIGATAVFQQGRSPRYGLDLSSAVGPFDVYGEMALRPTADRQMVRWKEGQEPQKFESIIARQLNTFGATEVPYETFTPEGPIIQVTGGATYTHAYSDTDTVTFGIEYFFNEYGYSDGTLFPVTFATGTYVPFYAGREYAGLFVMLLGPGPMDNGTIIGSTLGNLSDNSFISRVDFAYRALSFLQLEAFVAYHYGQVGEFHYSFDLPPQKSLGIPPVPPPGQPDPLSPEQRRQLESVRDYGVQIPAPTFDFGVGARITL